MFQELLDFEDVDIYFHDDPRLAGGAFGDLVLSYEQGAAIGVRYPDGTVDLNPPDGHVVAEGDILVVFVSRNVEAIDLRAEPSRPPLPAPRSAMSGSKPSRLLIVGWNPMAPKIVTELDKWVEPGSTIRVLIDGSLLAEEAVSVPDNACSSGWRS